MLETLIDREHDSAEEIKAMKMFCTVFLKNPAYRDKDEVEKIGNYFSKF